MWGVWQCVCLILGHPSVSFSLPPSLQCLPPWHCSRANLVQCLLWFSSAPLRLSTRGFLLSQCDGRVTVDFLSILRTCIRRTTHYSQWFRMQRHSVVRDRSSFGRTSAWMKRRCPSIRGSDLYLWQITGLGFWHLWDLFLGVGGVWGGSSGESWGQRTRSLLSALKASVVQEI